MYLHYIQFVTTPVSHNLYTSYTGGKTRVLFAGQLLFHISIELSVIWMIITLTLAQKKSQHRRSSDSVKYSSESMDRRHTFGKFADNFKSLASIIALI